MVFTDQPLHQRFHGNDIPDQAGGLTRLKSAFARSPSMEPARLRLNHLR
ncbi:MAG: hypothetical protein R2874_00485 [Desulfobacterales bacterium]